MAPFWPLTSNASLGPFLGTVLRPSDLYMLSDPGAQIPGGKTLADVAAFMLPSVQEFFAEVAQHVLQSSASDDVLAEITLMGGGSQSPGLQTCVSNMFPDVPLARKKVSAYFFIGRKEGRLDV